MHRFWSNQVLRFLVGGFGNTVFGYALYIAGLALNVPYQLDLVCAAVINVIFNFFTTGYIVFGNRSSAKIIGFVAVYSVTLLINLVGLTWLVTSGISKAFGQAVLLPLIVGLSFLANKFLVFRN
jgi:putative flippase GtrA